MPRTLEEIDADIAKFQSALEDALLGKAPSRMKHGDREIQFEGGDRVVRIQRRLLDLKHERSQITGERSPASPIFPPIMS